MTTAAELIRDILLRSDDVKKWPADEQQLYRGWMSDAASRGVALAELRTQKILEAARPSQGTAGADLIAAERMRQITEKGYDAAHDRGQATQLIDAAEAYTLVASSGPDGWHDQDGSYVPPGRYPWPAHTWNPADDRVENLVTAGALIAAAIDASTLGDTEPEDEPEQPLENETTPDESVAGSPADFGSPADESSAEETSDEEPGDHPERSVTEPSDVDKQSAWSESRRIRQEGGKALEGALAQCGISMRYAISGPNELSDVIGLLMQSDWFAERQRAVAATDNAVHADTEAAH